MNYIKISNRTGAVTFKLPMNTTQRTVAISALNLLAFVLPKLTIEYSTAPF